MPLFGRSRKQAVGAAKEQLACAFLEQQGLRLVASNYRCRRGELDLVMREAGVLVFVEVRFRRSDRHGSGADTVTRVKQARLTSAARRYLGHHPNHAQRACRFDVVSIGSGFNGAELRWIKAAFDAA